MTEPDVKSDGTPGTAGPWIAEINRSRDDRRQWLDRCRNISRLYINKRMGQGEAARRRFSILWSNVQTLQPAVYARTPKGVVTRRYRDADPVARQASEVLERGINYTLDAGEFDLIMRLVRDDYLLYAAGQAWARYEPVTEMITPEAGVYDEPLQSLQTGDGPDQRYTREGEDVPAGSETPIQKTEDGTAYTTDQGYEAIKAEHVRFDFVHRDDFFHSPARTWSEVWWVARAAYLTMQELKDRFGEEIARQISLDHKPVGWENGTQSQDDCKATVYEIWSKRDKKVFFVAEGYKDVLEEQAPFLKLAGFWPCPRPAFGTLSSETVIPIPDYVLYQDQAETINDLIARIEELQKQIKLAAFFPAGPSGDGTTAMVKVFADTETGVKFVPIPGWSSFMEKGGANGIQWLPIDKAAQALAVLEGELEREISRVYQITGISDIVRGDSNPNETATAQGIKSQWGSLRIRDRQQELARFARDMIQIVAEIIAEKFQPETLSKMTGVPLDPSEAMQQAMQSGDPQMMQQAQQQAQQMEAVMALLRDDVTRGFRIDIETDSTVEPDQQQEKQSRIEFLGMAAQFLQQSQAILQMPGGQMMAPLLGQLMTFGVRGFPVARELEETIEQTMTQIQQAMSQPQQQGPTPEQMAAEAQAKADQQANEMKMQGLQAQTQAKIVGAQADIAKTQAQTQAFVIKNQSQMERDQAAASMRVINGGQA